MKKWRKVDITNMSQVSKEEGVLVFAEGEVASAFGRMLLGDQKIELLGEIVTNEEEKVVAEVVKKTEEKNAIAFENTKLKQVVRGAPGATLVLVRRNIEQADSLALAR